MSLRDILDMTFVSTAAGSLLGWYRGTVVCHGIYYRVMGGAEIGWGYDAVVDDFGNLVRAR